MCGVATGQGDQSCGRKGGEVERGGEHWREWTERKEEKERKLMRRRKRERERNIVLPGVACPECPVYEAVNRPSSMCALQTLPHIIDKSVCVNERS